MKQQSLVVVFGAVVFLSQAVDAQNVASEIDKAHPCGASPLVHLAHQLARAQSCQFPNTLVKFETGSGLTKSEAALPYTSPQTRDILYSAREKVSFNVNSAFRTVLEQYWLATATAPRCGAVDPPGSSNHESGSAIDVQQYAQARTALEAAGCYWPNIRNDPWHFVCQPRNATRYTVRVVQRLWNLNHPNDEISEDGVWGPQTQDRLRRAPLIGFEYDGCGENCTSGRGDSEACGIKLLEEQAAAYAPPVSTDVNGDDRADLCVRRAAGFVCWPSSDEGWPAESWSAVPWSDGKGWDQPKYYSTIRMGDINGDGLSDVCARSSSGVTCSLAQESGFSEERLWSHHLSDEKNGDQASRYTTIRLADINADGRADLCARLTDGFGCWLSNGEAFVDFAEGPRWSDDAGLDKTRYFGTLRMGDIDGDTRADVCARTAAGVECALSEGASFGPAFPGPNWSDDQGYGGREYWSTLRLVDVSRDGRADLCIRTPTDYRCHFSEGDGFADPVTVDALSDENGWNDVDNYGSIRVGDTNGDGGSDICARSDNGLRCWRWNGASFDKISGPEWTSANNWDRSIYYQTIRIGDFDADTRSDICVRSAQGWRCHPATQDAFGEAIAFDQMGDAGGWLNQPYWATIQFATPPIVPEFPVPPRVGVSDDGGTRSSEEEPKLTSTCSLGRGASPVLPMLLVLLTAVWPRFRGSPS